jgi:hypothetical protein
VIPPVFVERDITNIVEFIFHLPMPPVDSKQRFWGSFLRSEACNKPGNFG